MQGILTVRKLLGQLMGAVERGIDLDTAVVIDDKDGWYDEIINLEDPTVNEDYQCFTLFPGEPMDARTTPMHYPPEPAGPATVAMPGQVYARFENGLIVDIHFEPSSPDVYAEVIAGDTDLDVTDVDGPFWKAMQAALASDPNIEWRE
jgi:hypothetical protein